MKTEIGSRIAEATSLAELETFLMTASFRYNPRAKALFDRLRAVP